MAGYTPSNYMAPNSEIRQYGGKFYEYTPTNVEDMGWGAVGKGGSVREVTAQEAGPAGQIYNAIISPEDWVKNAGTSDQAILGNLKSTFSSLDPQNKTGWDKYLADNQASILQKSKDYLTQNPGDILKLGGNIWNEFRYNPAQATSVANLQKSNLDQANAALKSIPAVAGTQNVTNTNRNLISQTPQAGYIKGYDTNNNYAPVYVPAGKYVPGVSLYPKASGDITPNSLQNESNISISNPTTSGLTTVANSNANIAVNQLQAEIKSTQDLKAATLSPAEKQGNDLSAAINSLYEQVIGKAAFTTQKTQELVDPLQTQLTTINNQIQAITAEQEKSRLDAEGQPMTLSRLAGEEARQNALYNSQKLTLTAQANALMNNITLAQKQVQEAVDARFAPIEESLAIKIAQLQELQPQITADDKVRADILSNYYEQQKQAINDQKQEETKIQNVMLDAIKAGLSDTNVINSISSAKTVAEATKIAAPYLAKMGQLDIQAKQASIAASNATIQGAQFQSLPQVPMTAGNIPSTAAQTTFLAALGDTNLQALVKGIADYDINPSSVATRNYKGVGGLNQSQVLALVKQYDPSFSQSEYAARQAMKTNFQSGKYSQNINSLNTAVGHITDILGNTTGLNNSSNTWYNAAKNKVAQIFGSGEIGKANLNISAATSELASVFKGTGATDQEIKNLGSISSNSSPAQVKAYIETASQLLSSRLQALDDTYTAGMGKAPAQPFLSLTSQQALLDLRNKGFDIKVPELANSPLVKISTFHDADPKNAAFLDQIIQAQPSFKNDPYGLVNFLATVGIEL